MPKRNLHVLLLIDIFYYSLLSIEKLCFEYLNKECILTISYLFKFSNKRIRRKFTFTIINCCILF